MNEIPVRTVFRSIQRLRGYDPDTAGFTAAQKAVVAELVNETALKFWWMEWWPELMSVDRRQYRPTYDADENYAADDEVFFEDSNGDENYYVSLKDGNTGQDPETETTWWEVVGDSFVRSISFTQDDETAVGAVDVKNCIYDRNPQVYPDTAAYPNIYLYQSNIIVRTSTAPVRPWLRFRIVPREYSWTDWATGSYYAIGDLVYQDKSGTTTVGQTFKAIRANNGQQPYTHTSDWEPIDFPAFMLRYVRHAVAAEQLSEDEGRDKSKGKAEDELENLQDAIMDSQGIRQRACYRSGM